jgi:hypothetical protein
MRQLLDVVHHAIELPLRIDFALTSEREAIEPFVVAQIAEYRLDGGNASTIECAACGRVDAQLHGLGMSEWRSLSLMEESHLADARRFGRAQALVSTPDGKGGIE